MKKESQVADKFLGIINKKGKDIVSSADKNYIKSKSAVVTSYDEETSLVTVKFPDIEREYTLFNKTGEVLIEHDSVKVEYTNNLSQGYVVFRNGAWKIEEDSKGCNSDYAKDYTAAIAFKPTGFDLTFVSGGKVCTNEFTVTEDSSGNITKITNETAGKEITVTYDG